MENRRRGGRERAASVLQQRPLACNGTGSVFAPVNSVCAQFCAGRQRFSNRSRVASRVQGLDQRKRSWGSPEPTPVTCVLSLCASAPPYLQSEKAVFKRKRKKEEGGKKSYQLLWLLVRGRRSPRRVLGSGAARQPWTLLPLCLRAAGWAIAPCSQAH